MSNSNWGRWGADDERGAGSDEPGALAFCGLSATVRTSTFCVLGPPRSAASGNQGTVPWIDDNFVGRVPPLTLHAAMVLSALPAPARGVARLRVDVDYQGDKFERGIEGLQFGRRLLVDARWSWERAAWSVELWGRNLGDARYIATMAGLQPQFSPTQPRPMHMMLADGRRIGFTLRYRS